MCREADVPMDAALGVDDDGVDFETSKGVKPITTFEGMNLKKALLKGLYQFGFEKPSAIQQRAILPIAAGAWWIPLYFFVMTKL